MNDDTLDPRFERDLRAVLAELEPADAPASLVAAVAGVAHRRAGRDWSAIRFAVGLAGLAAAAVVAAVLLTGALRVPGPSPITGGPDASGVPASAAPGEPTMTRFELALAPSDGRAPTDDQVQALAGVLRDRLYRAGYEHWIETAAPGLVVLVALDPGDADGRRQVTDRLTTVGRVDFVPMGQEAPGVGSIVDLAAHPPLIGGDAVKQAAIGLDQNGGRTVDLTLDAAATRVFADHTSTHIGDAFAITLDGEVITAPFIVSAIPDGQVQISGPTAEGFPVEEARRLVDILESGALPVPVELVEVAAATPTPRPPSVDAGLVTDQGRACAEQKSTPRTERISIGEDRGAVLLSGEVPEQAGLVYVDACLWQRTASGVLATDSIGGGVAAGAPDQVSVDRVVGSGSAPWHHLVAGRVGPGEGGVRVVLDDGSTVDAVLRDGWWLAWWEGEAGPTLVQRLDGAGAVIAEVRAVEGPPQSGPGRDSGG